ncbi:porin [Hymenobacter sp. 15J16-1T3B]|uniref:porin n=1 Tax=Hymenobacter sp. 15J16-1T3B TaxID=2886941 RepID=UPI001D11FC39|nr:porin [Hymenobacter sp. 15J16-1T3B]MCC3160519.1 porin [Hymenobacter sp. 15J16-1T3B]
MNALFLLTLTALAAPAAAQTPADSVAADPNPLTFYGFADGYYGYDFTGRSQTRPGFLYSHPRANEFALNNAVLGARYDDGRVRGAVGLHAGTYVEANYAAEPAALRPVYEAYAGFRPFARAWIDVGIFGSHIGFESALSKDNWTLTRSVMAENSPYYEAGARLSYEAGPKLTATGLVLNGWQNLRENNRAKALGTQLQWKPTAKLLINSSTFYGNEQPQDSARRRRYFHDFYFSYAATDKLSLAAVFDVGAQQRGAGRRGADTWHAGAALLRYQLTEHWAACARYEYYRAQRGVVIRSFAPAPADADFNVGGASLNLDYAPAAHVLVRVEGRALRSRQQPFRTDAGAPTARYANVTSSVALSF